MAKQKKVIDPPRFPSVINPIEKDAKIKYRKMLKNTERMIKLFLIKSE
jgi:hypothetical protein